MGPAAQWRQRGRFLTADPNIQDPVNGQSFNRYSYVLNNPLAYTDPSGYFSFGSIFKSIFKAVTNLVTNPQALAAVAVAIAVPYAIPALFPAFAAALGPAMPYVAAFLGGGLSGAIGSGGDIKSTFISALTATAFAGVGEFTGHQPDFLSVEHVENIVGHAAVGCASQAAGGGSCQAGALSGAAGSFAAPLASGAGFAGGLVITATVGGTASLLGGGKFANGAVTASFGYLYNHALTMALNSQPTTILTCDDCGENGGETQYTVFSGKGSGTNNPAYANSVGVGPVPPGTYYIIDRPSGGFLSFLDSLRGKDDWFALYSVTTKSDTIMINGVMRGQFRIHPAGPLGLSQGCVTVCSASDFAALSKALRSGPTTNIPGTSIKSYGTLDVKYPHTGL